MQNQEYYEFFEKFQENLIFHYTHAHNGCNAKNRIKKAQKPSEYNFQEVLHIFQNFSSHEPALAIKGERGGRGGGDGTEHFFDDFAPKVDRKHRVTTTSHLVCRTGSYSSTIMLLTFLCLCRVP